MIIPMVRVRLFRSILVIAAVLLPSLAMAESPEDAYLNADILLSKAKNQESRRFYKSAQETVQKAQSALTALQQSNPDWHPDWIERKMTGVREMTERLAPLVVEFPQSTETAPQANSKGYSVPPSAAKKVSAIDEALKPSISIASGVAAPTEVHKGSPHERYLQQDAAYQAHLQEMKAEAARKQWEAQERQRALKQEEQLNKQQLNQLARRQYEEEQALKKLEEAKVQTDTIARATATAAAAETSRQISEDKRRELKERQDQLLRQNQEQVRIQQEKVEESRRNLALEQTRIRQEQERLQKERADAMRRQEEVRLEQQRIQAEAERQSRIQAEEAARQKRVAPPRSAPSAPRESSGRSRFRIG